ncbi:tetratricopeptide repeat protein [Polynucleobacter paneuropaeus]|nr:tetratricopeptide repeat protein [Polynucleobacter paneuropaeus]
MQSSPSDLFNHSIHQLKQGNFDQAIAGLNSFIKHNPNNFDAYFYLGIAYGYSNRLIEGIETLKTAISIDSKNINVLHNLANLYTLINNHQASFDTLEQALAINPKDTDLWINRGLALSDLNRYQEAVDSFDKAIEISSNLSVAWLNKGVIHKKLNEFSLAKKCYEEAIKYQADYAEAFYNLGLLLKNEQKTLEAVSYFRKAVELRPSYKNALFSLGNSLSDLKQYEEAISIYDRVLNIDQQNYQALANRGMALASLKRYGDAIKDYEMAISIKPDIDYVAANLLHSKMQICDWSGIDEIHQFINEAVLKKKAIYPPFPMFAISDSENLHLRLAQNYSSRLYPPNNALGKFEKYNNPKIRLGYYSADFHDHATAFLITGLLELHDRDRFELIAFSYGTNQEDESRKRLIKAFDQFIDISKIPDKEVASLSRDLRINIGIDLKGFTQDSRPGIFAFRAAPIQVSYLGYPDTMGADYIDYILADEIVIPSLSQDFYTEKIAYLPNSYQPNDYKRRISNTRFTREDFGLPSDGFIFCCFNNNYKITPKIFDSWSRILKNVEKSVLWLLEDNKNAKENLSYEFKRRGISINRLFFSERIDMPEHLARHKLADLFLDTFPCNAHTTASDALWTGLPIITLRGKTFASRVASSLLNTSGLWELSTDTYQEYENLAISLASDRGKLSLLKKNLKDAHQNSPLFNTQLITKNIEKTFEQMMERYESGYGPETIYIG